MVSKCIVCKEKTASYNFPENKTPEYCKKCKKERMEDIVHLKCIVCKKVRPTYNLQEIKKPEYCKKCKKDDMVDINNIKKKCIVCKKVRASYNLPEIKKPEYCTSCKSDHMENIRSPKCINCKEKIASYNFPEIKKPEYCKKCKKDGMKDIKHPKCIICKKVRPTYNFPEIKKPEYCAKCKTKDMVDIIHHKCIVCKLKFPSFNLVGKNPEYCASCKSEHMENIISPKCINCKKIQAIYNFPEIKKPEYCKSCKTDDMIDVNNTKCLTPFCGIRVSNEKYKGYCLRCFVYQFPDEKVARNYKTKETAVVEFIKKEFNEEKWIWDKPVGESKRRPDLLVNYPEYALIIEVDENHHQSYDCICEQKRLSQISEDLKFKNIVFIRFNPDNYKKGDDNINSCWTVNKLGVCVINKKKEKDWKERLEILKEQVKYWLENKPDNLIEVIELFYDC